MRVTGAVPFNTSEQMNRIIKELQKEFGNHIRIYVKRDFVGYDCYVSRNQLMV